MKNPLVIYLLGLSSGIAIAWVLEAVLVGRGVVSTYLAPLAFGIPMVVVWFLRH